MFCRENIDYRNSAKVDPDIKVAIAFTNGLGNFIFLTCAIKVLRNWGYKYIGLITDQTSFANPRNNNFLHEVAKGIVDDVEDEYIPGKYDYIFTCGWSLPTVVLPYLASEHRDTPIIHWPTVGFHEVQAYLTMIGAGWKDFDGYLLNVADNPTLPETDKIRIALSQPSGSSQAPRKRWNKFPALSQELEALGYEVILLGINDELEGCVGTDYRNQLNIAQTAKVLKQCDYLIAPSTGMTVIADALSVPVVLLEGPMFTSRAHPIQAPYTIVRKYISCAPCFQTPLWSLCNSSTKLKGDDCPECMQLIQVEDVIQKLLTFDSTLPNYDWTIEHPEMPSVGKTHEHYGRVAYFMACYNRYYEFIQTMESFKASAPPPGKLYILDDGSFDPRLESFVLTFHIPGVEIEYIRKPIDETKKTKIRSARAYNILIDRVLEEEDSFYYYMLIDPDTIYHKGAVQRTIDVLGDASRQYKVALASPCHNKVHYNDNTGIEADELFSGGYKLRGGATLNHVGTMEFLRDDFGRFNEDDPCGSADLSKFRELKRRGYVCAIVVPSVAQHIGAFSSGLRQKVGVIAEDFNCESIVSDM